MRQLFENMKGAPEEEEYKKYMELQKKTLIANLRKVTRELEKDKQQLQTLQLEIGKTLLGDSIYSPEDLKEAIKVIKSKIQSEEEKTEKIKDELNSKKNNDDKGKESYKRFKSWAEEFDSADMEQKTMIVCQLFEKIEVAAGYKLYIQINATYQQFCQGMDINKVIKKWLDNVLCHVLLGVRTQ